ncbi:MAG: Tol-Pal system beta propeller repeat protein TolB [Burkholderiales bacterium]
MTTRMPAFFPAIFFNGIRNLWLAGLWCLAAQAAHAQIRIDIVGEGAVQYPVAILPLKGEDQLSQSVSRVVAADLQRSGLFKLVDTGGVTPVPGEPGEVQFPTWRARGADLLMVGSVSSLPDNRIDVRFRLMDVAKQQQLTGYAYQVTPAQLRATAHKIADAIYEKMTGDVGVFSTRIAYIVKKGANFELQVADADGFNPVRIVSYDEPIFSPKWSPDGNKLAFVSLRAKKPIVYVADMAKRNETIVANFKGSNSAPAWSPDGSRLAVVLTKDGPSQIYTVSAEGGAATRLTSSSGIDTEPSFSPDGRHVIFTSDRGGSPQIYRVAVGGGAPERLTFEGGYNVSPRYAPDGKSFAFVQRNGGKFNIAVQDFGTRQVRPLTDAAVDESPSFAPNGRLILYATEVRGRGILASVSSDGRVKQRFTVDNGDVREPAWGPLLK